jgi:hypothetical protein
VAVRKTATPQQKKIFYEQKKISNVIYLISSIFVKSQFSFTLIYRLNKWIKAHSHNVPLE